MPDNFDAAAPVPTSISTVEIVMHVTGGTPNTYAASYQFDILDQDGNVIGRKAGNLTPHALGWTLTGPQKTALGNCANVADVLKAVLDYLQNKAEGVLP